MATQVSKLVIAASFALCYWGSAAAQLDREIQVLEAFYSKDELVTSATRVPKPRSRTADNVTVITAEEIEAMGVHTVAEVLKYIPGIFIYSDQDFGAPSLIGIQGSNDRHAVVLLDGVRWNFLSGGNAETNSIPLGIIDRIEVIKGPASSAWGSALGGLINIVTRPAGITRSPSGVLQITYGEAGSLDAGAHLSGKAGPLGYTLFAGRQESRGLKKGRDFDNIHLFSKLNLELPEDKALTLSLGYSEPNNDFGAIPRGGVRSNSNNRNFFADTTFTTRITDALEFSATGHLVAGDVDIYSSSLDQSDNPSPDELYQENRYKETRSGISGQLVWQRKHQAVVLGADMLHGRLNQTDRSGAFLQEYGAPALAKTASSVDEWALYINDTILLGELSITPGFRFDYNTVSDSFISPSLGATYQIAADTLIRGTVSRGFQYPPLSFSKGGGIFLDPNPNLKPELVWSYQLGIETTAFRCGLLKLHFFHYRQKNSLQKVFNVVSPTDNDIFINKGSATRHGVEVEFKSKPLFHTTLSAAGAYVRNQSIASNEGKELWNGALTLEYDNGKSIRGFLRGNFVDWDLPAYYGSRTGYFLWDFTFQKKIDRTGKKQTTLFLTVHNLFDESQYWVSDYKNPSRWVEAGVRWAY